MSAVFTISPAGDGAFEVRVTPVVAARLATVLRTAHTILRDDELAAGRLRPDTHDDPLDELEWRERTDDVLASRRDEVFAAAVQLLGRAADAGGTTRGDLAEVNRLAEAANTVRGLLRADVDLGIAGPNGETARAVLWDPLTHVVAVAGHAAAGGNPDATG